MNGNISAVELNCKKCLDAMDQEHSISMSEVSKVMTQLRRLSGSPEDPAAPRAQPSPRHWKAWVGCLQPEVTDHLHKQEDWLPRKLDIKEVSPYGQCETHGLAAWEIKEAVRRIKELLDVDV